MSVSNAARTASFTTIAANCTGFPCARALPIAVAEANHYVDKLYCQCNATLSAVPPATVCSADGGYENQSLFTSRPSSAHALKEPGRTQLIRQRSASTRTRPLYSKPETPVPRWSLSAFSPKRDWRHVRTSTNFFQKIPPLQKPATPATALKIRPQPLLSQYLPW
ncbi:hypothetical protein DFJ77DRAFT_544464 [Powellomyces hirtus]|nr:hypothetical protein DFJ77DRAFT_544464 [Powellomyces hirtus]